MKALTDFLIERHRLVLIIVGGVMFGGYAAYQATPAAATPDIVVPIVMVQTPWPGASVETVEDQITIPIERELENLEGLDEIRSYSWAGFSFVVLEFAAGTDLDEALRETRDGVDEARNELPPDAESPAVEEVAFADVPIVILSLSGDLSDSVLRQEADALASELDSVPGVASVDVFGAPERAILIEPDPAALRTFGLTLTELANQIRATDVDLPIGEVSPGGAEVQMSFRGRSQSAEEIADLTISGANGRRVRLWELADVRLAPKKVETMSRHNGQPSVSLVVQKSTGENTITVGEAVVERMERMRPRLDSDLEIEVVGEQMSQVEESLGGMVVNFRNGFILVILVLLFFMGFRNSLLIALGIPLSVGFAMIMMRVMGFSFNNVTLFGLILVLGMIVDDDIIVVENIYRHQENGEAPDRAARRGIHEVSVPITAAIGTTIAAFTPLMFLSGVMGQFMKYIPFMVIFCLAGAWIVGHFILPSLSRLFLRVRRQASVKRAHFWRDRHAALLRKWGKRPGIVLLVAILFFGGAVTIIGTLRNEFFPDVSQPQFVLDIWTPTGTALEETDAVARQAEAILEEHSDWIDFYQTNVGSTGASTLGVFGGGGGPTYARIQGEFHAPLRRQVPELQDQLLEKMREIPGASFEFVALSEGPPSGTAIILRAYGDDHDALRDYTGRLESLMRGLPYLTEVGWGYTPSNPEAQVHLLEDRAGAMGVSSMGVAAEARAAFDGMVSHEVNLPGEKDEVEVVVRFPRGVRGELRDLSLLSVRSNTGALVPFDAVAEIRFERAPQGLTRFGARPSISVSANVARGSAMSIPAARDQLVLDMEAIPQPTGVELDWGGENEERETGQTEMLVAFMVALGLIFLIMVGVFDSFRQAMVVMSAVPFAIVGVVIGLAIFDQAFGFMALMAIVALSGIVVNDSIVLVDRVNQLRAEGHDLLESVAQGASQRLRPILMTSVTTISAFLPLAVSPTNLWRRLTGQEVLDMGSQIEFWGPLSISIMFGLAFATVLILLVVPCVYLLAERGKAKKAAMAGGAE